MIVFSYFWNKKGWPIKRLANHWLNSKILNRRSSAEKDIQCIMIALLVQLCSVLGATILGNVPLLITILLKQVTNFHLNFSCGRGEGGPCPLKKICLCTIVPSKVIYHCQVPI